MRDSGEDDATGLGISYFSQMNGVEVNPPLDTSQGCSLSAFSEISSHTSDKEVFDRRALFQSLVIMSTSQMRFKWSENHHITPSPCKVIENFVNSRYILFSFCLFKIHWQLFFQFESRGSGLMLLLLDQDDSPWGWGVKVFRIYSSPVISLQVFSRIISKTTQEKKSLSHSRHRLSLELYALWRDHCLSHRLSLELYWCNQ